MQKKYGGIHLTIPIFPSRFEPASLIREGSVHSSLYTDPDCFALEMQAIFESTWVFIGHESEIPTRGDYVRRTMGLVPVLMIRSAVDEISVVANRCAHRGNLLCQEAKGNKRSLACQYHGWVFSLTGKLLDVPFPIGFQQDKDGHTLRQAQVGRYRGFVFATLAADGPTLEEHLGHARKALDRASMLSPAGALDLHGGWVKHLYRANWKMLAENNVDGYHVNFVHDSFARGIKVQYKYDNVLVTKEHEVAAVARDLGNGHAEIDYAPTYAKPLVWLGVEPDRYPTYTAAMQAAYGDAEASEILRTGPPHTFIFPNLFIAETAVTMIQPLAVDKSVNWHTPLYLKGVPSEVNRRLLRLGEAALGPSAFLLADDAIISERQWRALEGSPIWMDLSRGLDRETIAADGTRSAHYSDETPQRGFWRHYKTILEIAPAASTASESRPCGAVAVIDAPTEQSL